MPSPIFPNGVSAGDTAQTNTVLWARSTVPGLVEFNLSTSPDFSDLVGQATASVVDPMIPVKVQISELVPGTTYYYRATSATGVSETGRFETPASDGTHAGLRFGVSGDGRGDLAPFPAIANADERGLDFFVKHGDTIYADTSSPAVPGNAQTLEEFRLKHAEVYDTAFGTNSWVDLQSSTTILATIDDHEVTDNFAGGAPQRPTYGSRAPRLSSLTTRHFTKTGLPLSRTTTQSATRAMARWLILALMGSINSIASIPAAAMPQPSYWMRARFATLR
jgi:phosphodiesterase/alkaline phosphatase D-like protein